MAFSLTGGKESKKTRATETNTLSDRAVNMISGGIADTRAQTYKALDPNAYRAYMDPYATDVRDATMEQSAYADAVARNQQDDAFAKAGAFGDNRRGVYDAELASQQSRDRASMLAGLNSAGYSQALGVAQGENQGANGFALNQQQLLNQLISMFGSEGTTTSKGKSTGYSVGGSFSPFGK